MSLGVPGDFDVDLQPIFERAAQRIERDGWRRGPWPKVGDNRCLLEAVTYELALTPAEQRPVYDDILDALLARIRPNLGGGQVMLIFWNDALGRTVGEVLALLRDKLPVPA